MSTRWNWLRLKGYGGIYQGLLRDQLFLDFRKCKHKTIVILGSNGSGKSTIQNSLHMYPDPNNTFLYSANAEKEGSITVDDVEYIFLLQHDVKEKKEKDVLGNYKTVYERQTCKAYLKKMTPDGPIEINPTGTVGTYKDMINSIFGLDPSFLELSGLSTEKKGIVDKTPSERKKFVNATLSGTEVFNNMHKVFTKRNSVNKSMMNNLMSKIDSLGEPEELQASLDSITNRIAKMKELRTQYVQQMAEADSTIRLLDPDLSIQNLYASIQAELEHIDVEEKKLNVSLEYLVTNNNLSAATTDQYCKMYKEYCDMQLKIASDIVNIKTNIESILTRREEESRAIQLKTQRLSSLQSELNYVDIENRIKSLENDIKQYEAIFNQMHIANAISISKDEYITGLNTLKDIKEMVDSVYSCHFNNVVVEAVEAILGSVDLPLKAMTLEDRINMLNLRLEKEKENSIRLIAKVETLEILKNRPGECNIDSCPFIAEALDNSRQNPTEALERSGQIIQETEKELKELNVALLETNDILKTTKEVEIIVRTVVNNKPIIDKLPCANLFIDTNTFLLAIKNGSKFAEINDLYQYINYANIFEEYKSATDTLYKLRVDYQIYESKNQVIQELENDIAELETKLNAILNQITESNKQISELELESDRLSTIITGLDTIISIMNKKKDIDSRKDELKKKQDGIVTNMEKIKMCLSQKEVAFVNLQTLDKQLNPLESDRDKIKYAIEMLKNYYSEYEEIKKSYKEIEVLKKYCNPTKEGIQMIFIRLYMAQIFKNANQLLSLFFNGRMTITDYKVEGNDFSIQCYSSYSNLVMDDISSCSRSEKTIASLAISTALMFQASTKYNVLRLDEIDEGLDSYNRLQFIQGLNTIINEFGIEQCFIVSHSPELALENCDVILLRQEENMITAIEGNVIYDYREAA